MCLLALCVSSLEKCLLTSFAHLKNWVICAFIIKLLKWDLNPGPALLQVIDPVTTVMPPCLPVRRSGSIPQSPAYPLGKLRPAQLLQKPAQLGPGPQQVSSECLWMDTEGHTSPSPGIGELKGKKNPPEQKVHTAEGGNGRALLQKLEISPVAQKPSMATPSWWP